MPTVNRQQFGMYVSNAVKGVPASFLLEKSARIDLAHKFGETPEMIARELELLYSMRRPAKHKTPRQLAARVMTVHDNTIAMLRRA